MAANRRTVLRLLLAGGLCAWSAGAHAAETAKSSPDTVQLTLSIPGMH
jgi:hypothetical protein